MINHCCPVNNDLLSRHSCEGWNPVKTSGYATLTRPTIWYHKVSQAFTVFLPVKSVGVTGDGRRYDYVVLLRVVVTVSRRIINEVPGISRVAYDISSKPSATIEWE